MDTDVWGDWGYIVTFVLKSNLKQRVCVQEPKAAFFIEIKSSFLFVITK